VLREPLGPGTGGVGVLIEDARQYALDLIRAAEKQRRDVPDLLRSRTKSGRLPATVLARIDAALSFRGNTEIEAEVQTGWPR
jgi:hypothetical protein